MFEPVINRAKDLKSTQETINQFVYYSGKPAKIKGKRVLSCYFQGKKFVEIKNLTLITMFQGVIYQLKL